MAKKRAGDARALASARPERSAKSSAAQIGKPARNPFLHLG